MSSRLSYALFGLGVLLACRPQAPHAERTPSSAVAPSPSAPEAAVAPVLLDSAEAPAPPPPIAEAGVERALLASPAPPRRVVVLGDSLSDPRVHGGGYLAPLSRCAGLSLDNYAKGGFMVNQMRRRFESEVVPALNESYSDIIVFGGVNDLYSDESAGRSVEKITADLTRIYELAKQHRLRVVALTVTPWGGFKRYYNERRGQATRRLNDWIRDQVNTQRVDVVVDAAPVLACGDAERLCPEYEPPFHDGLHFGREGHKKLAERLVTAFPGCTP